MDTAPTWLDHLKTLAANNVVRLEAIGPEGLEDLLARGVIQKDDRRKEASLQSHYEALQESHRHFIEARECLERLNQRLAPKSLLANLLSPAAAPSGPGGAPSQRLFELLGILKIQVRNVTSPAEVVLHLHPIQEYLYVEGRECLDRLAETDRRIDLLQKSAPAGCRVEGEGYFTLTPAGEAALPEAPVLEALETTIHTAYGPLAHRNASASHFREEPNSLVALLLEGTARGERPSDQVAGYEELLVAFERIPSFSNIRSLRSKISFLVRLFRLTRSEPKLAFRLCNRERIQELINRISRLLPSTLTESGWHLPYAADLFLTGGGLRWDAADLEQRSQLFGAVQSIQNQLFWDTRIGDGQSARLSLALTHAARVRNLTPGAALDGFIKQAFEVLGEAAQAAPYDLGDRGTRMVFGLHLAHAAEFSMARLKGPIEAFRALHAYLQVSAQTTPMTFQVLLHALATLDRLERQDAPMSLDTYAGIYARMRKRLNHHNTLSQVFQIGPYRAGDEAMFAANLTAQVCFRTLPRAGSQPFLPDAGMAGLYEEQTHGRAPMLGAPFGTLLLV